ncbi:thiamine phosphate synthase [Cryobacterium sp. PH29-G1]|uniref:thiamine phosphate synthase n=1 Tax=Cryobacterium sp. PH29-G1 TaxID=3046211 RepID=UPI0024BA53FE|nr:thiamine phosphate synthase [Cryobacterium sp. PH29-G1]MDJ0350878.1 thiamine phosphate synthase [Cryobacterium sp. PH29-G1]
MDQMTARLYLCTDARKDRGDFADFVNAAFAGGVDIIQLRDKHIDAAEELDYLEILHSVAERHARLWAVNDRADIAGLAGAPVFHVGQTDLPTASARKLLGASALIGLSTHTTEQVNAALAVEALDYFCVGPVWATPTKPGRAAVGTHLLSYAAARSTAAAHPRPWFAIGGIDLGTIDQVVEAGATRVVVVRAITDADDPTDAAQRLLASLPPLG